MLNTDQLSNLEAAKREIQDRELLLKTSIDVQVILQILMQANITTESEINKMRGIVRGFKKYADAVKYLEEAKAQINKYDNDPQQLLKDMFNAKLNGRK